MRTGELTYKMQTSELTYEPYDADFLRRAGGDMCHAIDGVSQ